jgi:hypothetical protein
MGLVMAKELLDVRVQRTSSLSAFFNGPVVPRPAAGQQILDLLIWFRRRVREAETGKPRTVRMSDAHLVFPDHAK